MSAKEKARSRAVAAVGNGRAMTNKVNVDDISRLEANVREVRHRVETTGRDAYGRLCDLAKRRAAARMPFGVQEWAEWERRHDTTDSEGNPFKVNNTHLPIYARILACDLPEVRPYVELRASVYDALFPELGGADATV